MNRNYLNIIIGILILIIGISVFFAALPFLIVTIAIAFVYFKFIRPIIKRKKNNKNEYRSNTNQYKANNDDKEKDFNGTIIDVDFEELNDEKEGK